MSNANVVTTPTPPWPDSGSGAGRDLFCVEDIEPDGAEVVGRLSAVQAVARRLITDQGTLLPAWPGDRESDGYGFNLRNYLNGDIGPRELAEVASAVELQATAEETIASATATVTHVHGALTVSLVLQDRRGPFSSVITVTDDALIPLVVGGV